MQLQKFLQSKLKIGYKKACDKREDEKADTMDVNRLKNSEMWQSEQIEKQTCQ